MHVVTVVQNFKKKLPKIGLRFNRKSKLGSLEIDRNQITRREIDLSEAKFAFGQRFSESRVENQFRLKRMPIEFYCVGSVFLSIFS